MSLQIKTLTIAFVVCVNSLFAQTKSTIPRCNLKNASVTLDLDLNYIVNCPIPQAQFNIKFVNLISNLNLNLNCPSHDCDKYKDVLVFEMDIAFSYSDGPTDIEYLFSNFKGIDFSVVSVINNNWTRVRLSKSLCDFVSTGATQAMADFSDPGPWVSCPAQQQKLTVYTTNVVAYLYRHEIPFGGSITFPILNNNVTNNTGACMPLLPCSSNRVVNSVINSESQQANKQSAIIESQRPIATVYPNPVKDVLNINLKGQKTEYIIMDTQGRIVIQGIYNESGTYAIDLAAQKPGVYILNLRTSSHSETHKILVGPN